MQRFLDIVFAGLALLLLSPLLLPLILSLRLTGEGKVFYIQQRLGRHGRPFGVLKFATMLENSPNMGTGTVTLKDDPRILPMGRLLRQTKLNELPQLINIVRGDMSVIGPRPQTQRCFDAFPKEMQAAILEVRPGLSGIGSIVFRDEENLLHEAGDAERFYDQVIMPYKGRLEEWYVTHQGLGVYLGSIALTIWSVLFKDTSMAFKVFSTLPSPPPELQFLMTGEASEASASTP